MFPRKLTHQVISNWDYPVVQTKYGKLRGSLVEGTFIFRGVQYAKAKRFQMPETIDSWEGIKAAVVYAPVPDEISTQLPRDTFTVPHFWYPQSEYCQNLNIWTPTIEPEAGLPVMVWIHGGGQEHGSAVEIFSYDGEELSKFGKVVVVSVNHRLNALGYLDLSSYGEKYKKSGFVGMADLVKALEWIRDNIAGFGGNPDNVMLFGQSGGGHKIVELMQMPAADGLYHKVSIQSGGGNVGPEMDLEKAARVANDIVETLGLTGATIHEIETMPYYKIATALNIFYEKYKEREGQRMQWLPPLDQDYYYGHPVNTHFRENTKNIPMLVGTCLGEFDSNAIDPLRHIDGDMNCWNEELTKSRLIDKYGDNAEEVVRLFRKAYPVKNIANVLFIDAYMRPGHNRFSLKRAASGSAPIWNWLLTLEMPPYGGSTPWHNAEEAYVFHQADYIETNYIPGVTERLQDQMAGAWVAFAYSGDPNHTGIPNWEPVSSHQLCTMIFDEITELQYNHDRELMDLLEKLKMLGKGGEGPLRSYGGGPRHHV